jgi:hypothetical protein
VKRKSVARVRFVSTSSPGRGYRILCGSSLLEEVSVVNHHSRMLLCANRVVDAIVKVGVCVCVCVCYVCVCVCVPRCTCQHNEAPATSLWHEVLHGGNQTHKTNTLQTHTPVTSMSSCRSAKAISGSIIQNSDRWRDVCES